MSALNKFTEDELNQADMQIDDRQMSLMDELAQARAALAEATRTEPSSDEIDMVVRALMLSGKGAVCCLRLGDYELCVSNRQWRVEFQSFTLAHFENDGPFEDWRIAGAAAARAMLRHYMQPRKTVAELIGGAR